MQKIPLLVLLETNQPLQLNTEYYLHICGLSNSDRDYLIDTLYLYKKEGDIYYFKSTLEYEGGLAQALLTATKISFDKRYFELLDNYDTILTDYKSALIVPFIEQI